MRAAFWGAAFVVAYVYVGYPLLLAAWARLRRAPAEAIVRPGDSGQSPHLSVILAARNEGHQLAARLENLLSQDYPADRFEVVVVSDGSIDDTEAVATRYAPRVRCLAIPPGGKAVALNAAVRASRHPILVFADARQRFAPDALRRLVAPFADPGVGGVSGELHFAPVARAGRPLPKGVRGEGQEPEGVGEGVGLYWEYEKWVRRQESVVGSVVGATGAIYALRRAAWKDLPRNTILDDVLAPMRAVLAGYRVVFEPAARAFDGAPDDADVERRRKTRTLAGNYQLLALEPRVLVPGLNPIWLQFVSHKIGRLIVPHALVVLLIANAALASAAAVYSLALILQVAFYVLALHGATLALKPAAPVRDEVGGRAPGRFAGTAAPGPKEWMNASLD